MEYSGFLQIQKQDMRNKKVRLIFYLSNQYLFGTTMCHASI